MPWTSLGIGLETMWDMRVCASVCLCARLSVCVWVSVCVCVSIVCMSVSVYTRHVCVWVYLCLCASVHVSV